MIMSRFYLLVSLVCLSFSLTAQIVSLDPTSAGPDEPVTLTFDATQGNAELVGAEKVYIHHGVVTDSPGGTAWQYVLGNWGQDDGIGEMTLVAGETDKWEIELNPSIREYFNVPNGENIFRISCVFRSADGLIKGTTTPGDYSWGTVTPNLDFYINLNAGNFVGFNSPIANQSFLESGEAMTIEAFASDEVSAMSLSIDEGSGYSEVASVSSGTSISYNYTPSQTSVINIRVTATIAGEEVEAIKSFNAIIISPSPVAELPADVIPGINYDENDDTKVTLVLEAPGKEYAYVVGDFSDWQVLNEHQMKRTPDGEFLWAELTGLTPMQEYVFQYWVEDNVKIGDPYAEKAADPWNDGFIGEETYPNLVVYDRTEFQYATVLQTGQEEYQWAASEADWQRPDVEHLVIYELLLRDFIGTHTFADLIDTLDYIKNLGVDAIELMPFNEFEGNESWGYNPAYYFAPDKYYGPKNDLKKFIEIAHQNGLAVIMDVVMNHAFGQNPMVKLYFENGAPTEDSPWFNQDHVGPFEWGYDWDHESDYTKRFLDRVNKFWISEYHIDGYRFDFTKGFTNYEPGGSIDNYDQSRIDILKRMTDEIWEEDPETYIILEHWGPWDEEQELADYGMKMWRNRSYDYVPITVGNNTGGFGGMDAQSHVSFFNSHDERRIAEHVLSEGLNNGVYNAKDPLIMYERVKMAAAFTFLYPGPKMLWQFDELGYDIHIDFNGRTGNKPLPWGPDGLGYYEDPLRRHIYSTYQGILDVRNQIQAQTLADAATNHKETGYTRRLAYDTPGNDLVVIGNFGLDTENIDPQFTQTGIWYDYFSGDSITVSNVAEAIELKAGQWHIYTTERLSEGMEGVVEVYENPVRINPFPFTKNQEITITFDATKAFPNGTAGLVGANKVYFHSGLVLDSPSGTELENVVGTFMDDGIGEMTEVSEDIWEITLTPADYYGLAADEDAFRIGMFFRDENNINQGMGFRNSTIYFNIEDDGPFVKIEPSGFLINEEITVTFNARKGNGELIGTDKVYMHSGVSFVESTTPWNNSWNNVVGNWGEDDGVGEMNPVPGEVDKWQITFVPQDYYGLSDNQHVHWISAVFRNANGTVKGTGTPGPIDINGIIHTSLDFFIRNDIIINTDEPELETEKVLIYPNPVAGTANILLRNFSGSAQIELMDINGKRLSVDQIESAEEYLYELNVEQFPKGLYLLRIIGDDFSVTRELVKM